MPQPPTIITLHAPRCHLTWTRPARTRRPQPDPRLFPGSARRLRRRRRQHPTPVPDRRTGGVPVAHANPIAARTGRTATSRPGADAELAPFRPSALRAPAFVAVVGLWARLRLLVTEQANPVRDESRHGTARARIGSAAQSAS